MDLRQGMSIFISQSKFISVWAVKLSVFKEKELNLPYYMVLPATGFTKYLCGAT